MLKIENYPKAYTQVYELLKFVNKENFEKIPKEFLEMLKERRAKNYNYTIDKTKSIEDQNILRETKAILVYILINFWSTKDEKIIIQRKFEYDIYKHEQLKKLKYSKNVFIRKRKNKQLEDILNSDKNKVKELKNTQIIKYEKSIFIKKFLYIIKNFLNYKGSKYK